MAAPATAGLQGALFGEARESAIERDLAALDLESMTPLEAMAALGELRERARGTE